MSIFSFNMLVLSINYIKETIEYIISFHTITCKILKKNPLRCKDGQICVSEKGINLIIVSNIYRALFPLSASL